MKKFFRIFLLMLIVVTLLAAGGVLSFRYIVSKSPEKVTATVQNQLQRNLGVPVTIARAKFEWKSGPRVILSRVDINEPDAIMLHIRSITAYLSFWKLLFGDVSVRKVRLIMPSGTVDLDAMKDLKASDETRPDVLIWKGTLKVACRGMDIPLSEVSGRITRHWANLRARTLGGRLLLETDLERPGRMTFDAYAVRLEQLDERFKGVAHTNLTVEDTKNGIDGSFSLQIKDLRHPWMHGTMDRLTVSASLSGDDRLMRITDLAVKSPVIHVSGKGELAGLSDIASWEDAVLNLEASSREFDYGKVVSVLPVEKFPGWLGTLLTRQIEGGRSRFVTAQYKGPVRGLFSGVELLDNLHVVQELKGQCFTAGHGAESMTDITGQVVYGSGDISFRNLSGTVGASRIDRVDIVFPGALRPFMRVGVDVVFDMPARDFMRAWQAAMVPEEIHRLLEPVTNVQDGQIKGRVNTFYDEEKRNPFAARGDIRIDGWAFAWGRHAVTGLSGTIQSDSFSKPEVVTLSGTVDKTRVRKLNLSLTAPFGEGISRFSLVADSLPPVGRFTPQEASIRVSGRGRGLDLGGTAELSAGELAFAGDRRTYRAGGVKAQGEFKTRLGDSPDITFKGLVVRNPSSRLEGSADLGRDGGSAVLSGSIDLKGISVQSEKATRSLAGIADGTLSLAWGKSSDVSGSVSLHGALLPMGEDLVTVDGPLSVGSSRVSMDHLGVRVGDVQSTITGELVRGAHPRFKGEARVEGLKIEGKGRTVEGVTDFAAEARLTLARCVFYGFPVEMATADAELKNGKLTLDNIMMETASGTASGGATLSLEGGSSFDVTISLKNSDMQRLLTAGNGTSAVDGMLDLEGHLWGSAGVLNGTLAAHARNGEIRKYALVSQIFSLLNVYRIAQNKDTDILSRHFTYNHLDTTLTIRNNVARFDDFSLDSNSIQLSSVGTYDVASKEIDAIIGVQPLESLDRTISMIPVVGWVLTGDNGRFIVVSMKVGGTMDDPKVMVAPIETLSNTVAASLLRSLRLPGRLVEESLRLIDGKKEQR